MRMKSSYGKEFRKKLTSQVVLLFWGCELLASGTALAAPQGGVVASGTAAISQSGSVTNINQSSNTAAINWTSFSTAPTETVNFNQPNASSVTLNRVIGNEASVLQGALNATGKVFLINSNGVLMTKGSTVNTAGFVASALNMTDADFNAGNYVFKGNGGNGSAVNQGAITAKDGGYVALLGTTVSNQGTITATKGTVALAGGNQITLNFNGDALVNVTVNEGVMNALVENKQAVYADGGTVIMTAKAADDLLSAQVNNTGLVQAHTIGDLKGKIDIHAYGGTASVDGTLDASAPATGDGGSIETSGNHVKIADSAVITTKSATGKSGDWLIDPDGFTVSLAGDMSGAALTKALANGNVTIASTQGSGTDGNINVNEAVTWSANTLTLNATNNIYVNNIMTATGTAGLAATYGTGTNADGTPMGLYTLQSATNGAFSGKINFSGTGGVALNGENYTVINSVAGLVSAKSNLNGRYILGADISGLTASSWTGAIGDSAAFTGKFNGFGHLITSPALTATGLFGTIGSGATVSNLGITGATVAATAGYVAAAGVLANVNQGTIANTFAGGTLNNTNIGTAGGLVGDNSGLIGQSYFYGTVNATNIAGGLVGTNEAGGRITLSSARGANASSTITGSANTITYVGGLVGNNAGTIDKSYAGNMIRLTDANSISGGFAGLNTGTIDQSYASMGYNNSNSYSTGPHLAGFVGQNSGTISNAYTTSLYGTNASMNWAAGFAYKNAGTISSSYVTAYSSGTAQRYGFVYDNTGGTLTNDYWHADSATGAPTVADSSAAKNLTATQAAAYASYAGFDPTIWGASVSGYPILRNIPIYVSTSSASTYGSTTASSDIGTLGLTVQGLQGGGGSSSLIDFVSPMVGYSRSPFIILTDNGYVDAGTQTAANVLSSSVYSNIKGIVTVNPKALTISGAVADKTYDGTTSATLATGVANGGLVGLMGDQALNITYTSAAFTDKNAAEGKTVNLTYTVANGTNGGKASNYTIATTTTATIGKKAINVYATGNDKVYDGTTSETVSWLLPGKVAGDNLSLTYTAAFADKNAGQNKTVTVSGFSLTGTDSGNYVLQNTTPFLTTATINPLALALSGAKQDNGTSVIAASDLGATNVLAGDTVVLGGSAKLSGTTAGVQSIIDTSGLTVSNPNYTVVGSVGNVVIGNQSLALDHVASGTATIATSGKTTTITETTDKAVIDWLRFSVAADETVNFVQPHTYSIVLNRVVGNESSVISGALNANGRVFILNSNGVLFSAGSSVNVGGLVASTLGMSDSNFAAGNYVFSAVVGTGSVVAAGDIVIVDGGFLALVSGNGVTDSGTVTAHGGKALLTSTTGLTLALNSASSGLSNYIVGNLAGATIAGGNIDVAATGATGGLVEIAGTKLTLAGNLALNTGSNGTLSLSLPSISIGTGGTFGDDFVTTNLAVRNLALNAFGGSIDINAAVNWSTDTTLSLSATKDININKSITATGTNAGLVMNYWGNYNILTPATYSGTVLDKNGNPVANQAPAGTTYASITLSGANAGLKINGNTYTLIHSMSDLDHVDGMDAVTGNYYNPVTHAYDIPAYTIANSTIRYYDPANGTYDLTSFAPTTGYYALAGNLDASGTTYTNALVNNLSGAFAGLGHTISNLSIVTTAAVNNAAVANLALIGQTTAGSAIRDIGLLNATISSTATVNYGSGPVLVYGNYAGALVGTNLANISQAYSTGSVTGTNSGGLVGMNATSATSNTISDSFSDAAVYGSGSGGLIGRANYVNVYRSHATGNVSAVGGNLGGLIGYVSGGTSVYDSYATGNVTGGVDATGAAVTPNAATNVGGLIGNVYAGATAQYVKNSFATGNVIGATDLGGLIGGISAQAANYAIDNCYATGNVTSLETTDISMNPGIGGLVGFTTAYYSGTNSVTISNSHATGNVSYTGTYGNDAGGLVGYMTYGAGISNSYATGNVTGGTTGTGAGGLIGGSSQATISNSYATGDVTGNVGVGGLGGNNNATVTNSWASGDVTGTGNNTGTGGLFGNNNGTIINSYATGDVNGLGANSWTGGLVGQNAGTITDCYASGKVTGPSDYTGGVVGVGFRGATVNNSYFNSEINPDLSVMSGFTPANNDPGVVNGGGGLTTAQMSDARYYADGTIGDVLAGRAEAAAEAARQAAHEADANSQAAQVSGQAGQNQASLSNLSTKVVKQQDPAAMDDQFVYIDSDSYSADIKAIDADGVRFELEDASHDKDKKK